MSKKAHILTLELELMKLIKYARTYLELEVNLKEFDEMADKIMNEIGKLKANG